MSGVGLWGGDICTCIFLQLVTTHSGPNWISIGSSGAAAPMTLETDHILILC